MAVRFYMDHHIPHTITEGLLRRNVDVVTAFQDGASMADDVQLLARATELERVLFSQDRDLLVIASQWMQYGRSFSGLLYAHQLNITIGRAIRDLELIANACDSADMQNKIEFLPL